MLEAQLTGKEDFYRALSRFRQNIDGGRDHLDVAVSALEGHPMAKLWLDEEITRDLNAIPDLGIPGAPVIDRGGVRNWLLKVDGVYKVRDRRPEYQDQWYAVDGLYPFAMAMLEVEAALGSRREVWVADSTEI